MIELLQIFLTFLKLGAFTIGGGYAIIPLINQEMVAKGWMTQTEAIDMVAISQMTPGPLAINASTFAGMRAEGVPGAVIATFGVVLPSFIIATLVGKYFFRFQKSTLVQSLLSGMRPVVLALIAAAALSIALEAFLPGGIGKAWDIPALCVGAVSAALVMTVKKIPRAAVIVAAGVFGAVFLR